MIIRKRRTQGQFFQVDKGFVNDSNLSLSEKGLLLYMLSKPDDWIFYQGEIALNTKCSIPTVSTHMNNLITKGYLTSTRIRNTKGKFQYNYKVYEDPKDNPDFQKENVKTESIEPKKKKKQNIKDNPF